MLNTHTHTHTHKYMHAYTYLVVSQQRDNSVGLEQKQRSFRNSKIFCSFKARDHSGSVCMHVCVCVCMYVCMYAFCMRMYCMYACMQAYAALKNICIYIHACMFCTEEHMYIYIHACMYSWFFRTRDGNAYADTHTYTHMYTYIQDICKCT